MQDLIMLEKRSGGDEDFAVDEASHVREDASVPAPTDEDANPADASNPNEDFSF